MEIVPRMYGDAVDGVRFAKGAPAAPELEGADALKQRYGDEYPLAVVILGSRLPMARQTRFVRYYYSEAKKLGTQVSRFEDGTATMTYAELRGAWPRWSEDDKLDFVCACNGLYGQADYPDMVRFVMKHGHPHLWSGMALQAAGVLEPREAFELLVHALDRMDGHTANITQAIAATGHPDAKTVLWRHLDKLWDEPTLWDDDSFSNWKAFDATCCIANLLQLGIPPATLEQRTRRLSAHPCKRNRESCGNFLGGYYDWLPKPGQGALDLPS